MQIIHSIYYVNLNFLVIYKTQSKILSTSITWAVLRLSDEYIYISQQSGWKLLDLFYKLLYTMMMMMINTKMLYSVQF